MSTLDKIWYLLKIKGMSGSLLAKQIGVSRSTITDWKNGKTASYKNHIVAIANALSVTPEYLLDEQSAPITTESQSLSQAHTELLNYCLRLSDCDFQKVLEYAKLLSAKSDLE